jgi:hypothetical protein
MLADAPKARSTAQERPNMPASYDCVDVSVPVSLITLYVQGLAKGM